MDNVLHRIIDQYEAGIVTQDELMNGLFNCATDDNLDWKSEYDRLDSDTRRRFVAWLSEPHYNDFQMGLGGELEGTEVERREAFMEIAQRIRDMIEL